MNKNIKLATVITSLGLVLFSYQNCAQIKPGLQVTDSNQSALSIDGGQAIILDQDDNIVDVITDAETETGAVSAPVVQVMDAEPELTIVQQEEPDSSDPVEETAEEVQASSCVELAKKHKNSIDVSELKVGTKISLVRGKTFIYSSKGPKAISSLSIGKSCGRTILCDVTIEKISEVNGRLDLYKDSNVKEYESQPKNIKRHK